MLTLRYTGGPRPRHQPSLNSLSAIPGQEADEEDWEKEMRGLRDQEEVGPH
jgi:hypothetical protein